MTLEIETMIEIEMTDVGTPNPLVIRQEIIHQSIQTKNQSIHRNRENNHSQFILVNALNSIATLKATQ
jgi:hypothetical protein